MRLRWLMGAGCALFAMAISAVPAMAATAPRACTAAGQPTAASDTSNIKAEANTIFKDVQLDAQRAMDHADMLQMLSRDPNVDWQAEAIQLGQMSAPINDMGSKVCRLEAIRRVVSPEQQRTIDQISAEARLMALHQQDAYNLCTTHPEQLWRPTYRNDVTNLYNEASALTRSVDKAASRISS